MYESSDRETVRARDRPGRSSDEERSSLRAGDLVDQPLDRVETDVTHRVIPVQRLPERVRVGDEEVDREGQHARDEP